LPPGRNRPRKVPFRMTRDTVQALKSGSAREGGTNGRWSKKKERSWLKKKKKRKPSELCNGVEKLHPLKGPDPLRRKESKKKRTIHRFDWERERYPKYRW